MKSYNGFTAHQRQQSWEWLQVEMAAGRVPAVVRCCACSQDVGRLEYHAEDYNWPFGPHVWQFPLCYRCHMMVHCRGGKPEAWLRYWSMVSTGYRYEPASSFGAVCSQLGGGEVPGEDVGMPDRDILGEIASGVWVPDEVIRPPRGWRQLSPLQGHLAFDV